MNDRQLLRRRMNEAVGSIPTDSIDSIVWALAQNIELRSVFNLVVDQVKTNLDREQEIAVEHDHDEHCRCEGRCEG